MYPILYNSDGIYFHNGKGKLVDCISCVVSEELNGDYSLEFTYPITGPFFDSLLEGGSVSVICPHMRLLSGAFVPMRAAEWFDIYKHSVPINGVVTFYANHVSRRLARLVYAGGMIGTGTGSVDGVLNRSQPSVATGYDGLRFYVAPYSPPATINTDVPVQSVLATYIGAENSFVSEFGGDFIWTSDSLYSTQSTPPLTTNGYYVSHRGEDRGAEIRHGYNLTDINSTSDKIGVFNAVVPYWEDGNGNRTFVTGYVVQPTTPLSPIKAVPLDATSAFSTKPTEAQLTTFARNWLDNNIPWNGEETLEVDFVNGAEIDPHGADIALGDTVHVYWKDGRVDTQLRVVSYKYDVLAERYSELKLGTQQTQFVAVTGNAVGGGVGGITIPDNTVFRYGNSTRFVGAINDIDITPYQTAGGYAFLLVVTNWITFNDASAIYLVSGIASGAYQQVAQIYRGAHPPQSVAFNGTDKVRVIFYNNDGGYYSIIPLMLGGV